MKSLAQWANDLKARNAEKAAIKDDFKNKEKQKPLTVEERLDRIEQSLKLKTPAEQQKLIGGNKTMPQFASPL